MKMGLLTPDEEIIREMREGIPKHKNICPSLETRTLENRKLDWPPTTGTIDGRFEAGCLALTNTSEIEQIARIYRLGFPELFGGVYEDLHFPARYAGLTEQMKILVLRDLQQNNKVVSAWTLTPSEANMSVEFSLTVTDPDYRGKGLCKEFTKIADKLVEETGAELGIAYCATFHKTTQRIFQELGFGKQAILKGFILANIGEGRYARDSVVMYTKFYNNADRLCSSGIRLL